VFSSVFSESRSGSLCRELKRQDVCVCVRVCVCVCVCVMRAIKTSAGHDVRFIND